MPASCIRDRAYWIWIWKNVTQTYITIKGDTLFCRCDAYAWVV